MYPVVGVAVTKYDKRGEIESGDGLPEEPAGQAEEEVLHHSIDPLLSLNYENILINSSPIGKF